jgi:CHAT domain-containing protein/cytochrome c-type biogenesis protein CcmH/NrfG
VEIRLLSEPQYSEEFDMMVDDIIDQYRAGEFEGEELERVRAYFFKSEARREKLRWAIALDESKNRPAANGQGTGNPAKVVQIDTKRRSFTQPFAIAAMLLVTASIGFFVWRSLRPQSQSDLARGLVAFQTAYRDERPVDVRLSGLNYAKLPNQRGGNVKVDDLQRDLAASSLLRAVADNPNDAAARHALGQYYVTQSDFEKAIRELTAALELDPRNAKIHSDLGAALLEQGIIQGSGSEQGQKFKSFGTSLQHLNKAIELDPNLLDAYFNRALLHQHMGQTEQAKKAWQEYLQKDPSSPWATEAQNNLKQLEAEQSGARDIKDDVKDFVQAQKEGNDGAAWQLITDTYTTAGNAITNYLLDVQLGIERSELLPGPNDSFSALELIAKLETSHAGDRYTADLLSQISRAPPNARAALAQARRHMRLAYALFTESKYPDAIEEYRKAKHAYELAGTESGVAFVEYRLAHCYVFLPDHDEARLRLKRLLTIGESNHYRWLLANCLYSLAHVSADSYEYSDALEYSERALHGFEDIDDANGVLRCLTQIADFYQVLNRMGRSLSYLSRAMAIASSRRVEPMQRWILLAQMGFCMTEMDLYEAAVFYQKEAVSTAVEMKRPLPLTRSYNYLSSTYAAMYRYDQAADEAKNGFEVGRSLQSKVGGIEIMATALLQLGEIRRQAGDCGKAIEEYDTSLRYYSQIKFSYFSYRAYKGKLQCYMANSDHEAVESELRRVLDLSEQYRSKITVESQRNSFYDLEQGVYDLAVTHELNVNDKIKGFEYSEESKGRSLLDAVQRGAAVRGKGADVEVKLHAVSRSLSATEVMNKMPRNAQILQYAVLDDRLVMWLVTNSRIEWATYPIPAPALNEKVRKYLETVSVPPDDKQPYNREPAAELYGVLIAPIKDLLDQSQPLCIVPDKILNYVPFAALVSPESKKFLIEDYRLCLAPSSSLFVYLSSAAERKAGDVQEQLLSVGNPNFNRERFRSLRDLPASVREAREVSRLYQNSPPLIRDQARESKIKEAIESAGVVHFATHYVLNEQSEILSGFPLTPEDNDSSSDAASNGFLQSYEIYRLNLRRVRLVVLSACSTGIERQYSGEGAVGAVRPFLVAGVPTAVASLWPVDSDATAELMISFHKHRHNESQSVTQALRTAQIEMLQKPSQQHPYYWAPFAVIGGLSSY